MSEIRRRIGHFIQNEDETFDFVITKNNFDEECYSELKKYVGFIFKLQPILISYEAIELNYAELTGCIQKYSSHFLKTKASSATHMGIMLSYFVEANQKFINFLSSVTSFFSCAEVILKKEFGKKSEKFREWNEYRKNLYSQYFSYRFLYEMRNFSQHRHLPISSVDVQLDNILEGEFSFANTISMHRDKLINSGYNWGNALSGQIAKLERKIDFSPLINEYMDIVLKIAHKYIETYQKQIDECFRYMNALKQLFDFPDNSTPVLYIGETPIGRPVPREMEIIPFFQFVWISKRYFELKSQATKI